MANLTEEEVTQVSQSTQARILAAWAALEAGNIAVAEFVTVALNIVLSANARAYRIGARAVMAFIEKATGVAEVLPPNPHAHHLDEERLTTALETILASGQDTPMQLERLADNEPKDAASRGAADVIRGSKRVSGWVRDLDGPACQLCTWWARLGPDGPRVWRPEHPMPRHPGCGCIQKPVVKVTANYQTEKQAHYRARERARKQKENA